MTKKEDEMFLFPKSDLELVKSKLNELIEIAKKGSSPLDGYVAKKKVMDLYGFSDRTWSRLKRKGLIQVRKLGGLQFVKAQEFIEAIEANDLQS